MFLSLASNAENNFNGRSRKGMLVRRHPDCKVVLDQLHHRHDEGYTTVGVCCAFRWWLRRGSPWFRSQPICLLHVSLSLWCFFPPSSSPLMALSHIFCSCCLDSTQIGSFSITIKFRLGWSHQPWSPLTSHVTVPCWYRVSTPCCSTTALVCEPCSLCTSQKRCCGFVLLFINTIKGFGKYVSLLLLKHATRNRM